MVVVEILNYLFPSRQADQYHLRIRSQFIIPNVKAAIHGFESLAYLGPRYGRLYHNFKSILDLNLDSLDFFRFRFKF